MMNLALYLDAGIHQGGWRYPQAARDNGSRWPLLRSIALRAEAAKLDMVFIADKLAIDDIYGGELTATVRSRPQGWSEPLTLLAALAAVTTHIGLGGTVSSSYSLPYTVARQLANIDHISEGRAAWNVVTSVSDAEARNYGRPQHYSHSERYRRAAEFIPLVRQLWDSFAGDAVVNDQQNALYARPERFRYLNHHSEWFSVRGPLNIPRPPQGYPVTLQAGVSEEFIDLAARYAEVMFVVQPDQQRAAAFCQRIKQKVALAGRQPQHARILPGIVPVIAETRAAAEEKKRHLDSLITVDSALSFMSASMNHDLGRYPVDEPVPDIREVITGSKGRFNFVISQAIEQQLTLGQMALRYAESLSFPSPAGTADDIAAMMAEWYQAGACDGFVILPAYLETDGNLFLDEVVPRLQRAGVFRNEYPGKTLRDTLGLNVPENPFFPS